MKGDDYLMRFRFLGELYLAEKGVHVEFGSPISYGLRKLLATFPKGKCFIFYSLGFYCTVCKFY